MTGKEARRLLKARPWDCACDSRAVKWELHGQRSDSGKWSRIIDRLCREGALLTRYLSDKERNKEPLTPCELKLFEARVLDLLHLAHKYISRYHHYRAKADTEEYGASARAQYAEDLNGICYELCNYLWYYGDRWNYARWRHFRVFMALYHVLVAETVTKEQPLRLDFGKFSISCGETEG